MAMFTVESAISLLIIWFGLSFVLQNAKIRTLLNMFPNKAIGSSFPRSVMNNYEIEPELKEIVSPPSDEIRSFFRSIDPWTVLLGFIIAVFGIIFLILIIDLISKGISHLRDYLDEREMNVCYFSVFEPGNIQRLDGSHISLTNRILEQVYPPVWIYQNIPYYNYSQSQNVLYNNSFYNYQNQGCNYQKQGYNWLHEHRMKSYFEGGMLCNK